MISIWKVEVYWRSVEGRGWKFTQYIWLAMILKSFSLSSLLPPSIPGVPEYRVLLLPSLNMTMRSWLYNSPSYRHVITSLFLTSGLPFCANIYSFLSPAWVLTHALVCLLHCVSLIGTCWLDFSSLFIFYSIFQKFIDIFHFAF